MALSEAAQRVAARKQVDTTCVFGRILRDLTDDDRAYYDGMVAADETWVHMAQVFNDELDRLERPRTNDVAIRRHTLGVCTCR